MTYVGQNKWVPVASQSRSDENTGPQQSTLRPTGYCHDVRWLIWLWNERLTERCGQLVQIRFLAALLDA